jgi:phosphatidylglycerol---prolipoprotein diacylglyceryl transferase
MELRCELSASATNPPAQIGFPRFFTLAGYPVNSYKVCLSVGICVGTFTTAALADSSGLSLLRIGLAAMVSALAGLIGARMYHLLVHAPVYFKSGSPHALWDAAAGGLSVFGALLTFVPVSFAAAALVDIPAVALWDHMAIGVLAGGFWIRLGCVFNGCCAGRATDGPFGVRLHDTRGVRKRRFPVQFMEMAWWMLGLVAFLSLWPQPFPPGSYALGVLAWYGAGRFLLEPLRERPDVVCGRVRINQLVAALITLGAGTALIFLGLRS